MRKDQLIELPNGRPTIVSTQIYEIDSKHCKLCWGNRPRDVYTYVQIKYM